MFKQQFFFSAVFMALMLTTPGLATAKSPGKGPSEGGKMAAAQGGEQHGRKKGEAPKKELAMGKAGQGIENGKKVEGKGCPHCAKDDGKLCPHCAKNAEGKKCSGCAKNHGKPCPHCEKGDGSCKGKKTCDSCPHANKGADASECPHKGSNSECAQGKGHAFGRNNPEGERLARGKQEEFRKKSREKLDRLKMLHKDNKEKSDAAKQKTGPNVGERKKHLRRMARLKRLAEVAEATDNNELSTRVKKLRLKETKRHKKVMAKAEK